MADLFDPDTNDPFVDGAPDYPEVPLEAYDAEASQARATSQELGASGAEGADALDPNDPRSEEAFRAREEARRQERQSLYERLNPEQREAVFLGNESSLVLAAAGSGKTSVLTARIAKLLTEPTAGMPALQPKSVMAVTFTNKAAQEMRLRLQKLLDKRSVQDLWVGTFHSLCNRILRENAKEAGLPKTFAILDTDGQESMARGILKDLGLTKSALKESIRSKKAADADGQADLLAAADPLAGVGGVLGGVLGGGSAGESGVRDAIRAAGGIAADEVDDDSTGFVTPAQCARYISSRKEAGESPNPPRGGVSLRSSDIDQLEAVYSEYQDRCRRAGLLDFQDLLTRTVELLKKSPDVRKHYQERFQAILVDEFQDTNDLQYDWLRLIKGERTHVMAVGDDDQSIYAFRGAKPENMARFLKDFASSKKHPDGRLIRLERNYRSLPHILDAANAVIGRNTDRLGKVLKTDKPDAGDQIDMVTFANGALEAASVAKSIHRLIKDADVPPSEIAVLYRTNIQSRLLEGELNKLGVPVTVYGGFRFYERQEIKYLLAYLDLVCDITRDLSFAKVANFPPRGIGERTIEDLRQHAQHRRISMMEMVGERSSKMAEDPSSIGNAAAQKKQRQLEGFVNIILELTEHASTMPLHKLIEATVEKSGLKDHYIAEAGGSKAGKEEAEERLANIAELVSAARQFELDNPELAKLSAAEQLPEYLAYVALMTSTSESDMSKKNTVSLMTVHSAKGLEFDHVFITGLEEHVFPHSRAIQEDQERGNGKSISEAMADIPPAGSEVDGDEFMHEGGDLTEEDGEGIQEERRLMYVALTRARKRLVLTNARERMVNGEIKKCVPSRFVDELPLHRVNFVDDSASRDAAQPRGWSRLGSLGSQESPRNQEGPRKVAIIGTAGRDKERAGEMNGRLWLRMLEDARSRIKPTDELISGGAAWADHLAVALFLEGRVRSLRLHLPAPIGPNGRFEGGYQTSGSAANYYHDLFTKATGINGLEEIRKAIDKGAKVTFEPVSPGYGAMSARNAKVAKACDTLVAYTWCEGDEPADGGTFNTWNAARNARKVHVSLVELNDRPGASAVSASAPATKGDTKEDPKGGEAAPAGAALKPWQRGFRKQAQSSPATPVSSSSTSSSSPDSAAEPATASRPSVSTQTMRRLDMLSKRVHGFNR